MVSIVETKTVEASRQEFSIKIDETFILPIKWLYYHYKMGNLELTDSLSKLRRNKKLTDTVLVDFLSDFTFMDSIDDYNYEFIINRWSQDKKWIGLSGNSNATQIITFKYEGKEVMSNYFNCLYFVENGSIKCIGNAIHEYYYNRKMLDYFGTKLPIKLKSLAPFYGEDNAILG